MGGRGAATATTTARAGRWMDDLYDDDFDEDENPWADDDDFDEDDDEEGDEDDEEGGGKVRDASAHKDALRGVGVELRGRGRLVRWRMLLTMPLEYAIETVLFAEVLFVDRHAPRSPLRLWYPRRRRL